MKRFIRIHLLLLLVLFGFLPAGLTAGDMETHLLTAQVVSVQGEAQIRRADGNGWLPLKREETCRSGDTVRVLENSRVGLMLDDGTVLRLDQLTTLTISGTDNRSSLLRLVEGALHFFSTKPRNLQVETPFANAAIEGTEFLARVYQDRTFLAVYEGWVNAINARGQVLLQKGEAAEATADAAPRAQIAAGLRDAVQWTLYYPPILNKGDLISPGEKSDRQLRIEEALDLYIAGNPGGALKTLEAGQGSAEDLRFLACRGALYLAVGRVKKAEEDIGRILRAEPENSLALALQSVAALAAGDKNKAQGLATRAVAANPGSITALTALSYVQQARFDLEGALTSMQKAVALAPDNALAWARLAELLQCKEPGGDDAQAAAAKALALNPGLERTQTVKGFASLLRLETDAAMASFQNAIAIDDAAPLPRLGLGLAQIRKGRLAEGRSALEIAASLDPGSSLLRSYLGKAYFEEKRDQPAGKQFSLAKELDPLDPTPWFYDAIKKQAEIRPVEALLDLQHSIRLNNNRAVYRSTLLLDNDLAARSASLGRIYRDLGFEQLALASGTRSMNLAPADHAAHRFLADTYAGLPRHQIARVSELLQAQMLQPLNLTPLQPQLAQPDLAILEGSGPADAGYNEYTPLFLRNGAAAQLNGVAGSNSTWGNDLAASGLYDNFSVSAGQYHYQTDGFRENNDQEQDIYNVFSQVAVTPSVNIQAEIRRSRVAHGDLDLNFDPADFSILNRRSVDQDTYRLGGHFVPALGSDLLFSYIYADRDGRQKIADLAPALDEHERYKGYQAEAKYLFQSEKYNLAAGFSKNDLKGSLELVYDWTALFGMQWPPSPPFPPLPYSESRLSDTAHEAMYVYSHINLPSSVVWTLGLGYDSMEDQLLNNTRLSPKLGMQWSVLEGVGLRFCYLEHMKRPLVVEQTLENTQVAGFNQLYDDDNGSVAKQGGIGLDFQLNEAVSLGMEGVVRAVDFPDFTEGGSQFHTRDEKLYRTYLSWIPARDWAVSLEGFWEETAENLLGPSSTETVTAPLEVRYYGWRNIAARFAAIYFRQKVPAAADATFTDEREEALLLDAGITYLLPKRMGSIGLEVKNILSKEFYYQDLNFITSEPVPPPFIPERTILLRLNFRL